MRHPAIRNVALSVAAAALVAGLTACGSDDVPTGDVPAADVTAGATFSTDVPTAPADVPTGSVRSTASSSPTSAAAVTSGNVNERVARSLSQTHGYSTARIAFTQNVTSGGQQMRSTGTGQVDYRRPAVKMDITMTSPSGPVKTSVITVEGATYVRMGTGTWTKAPAQAPRTGSSADPSESLEMLKGAGNWKEAGQVTVRGVKATRYTGTLSVDKLIEQAPQESKASVRQLKAQGLSTIPVEVAIDAQGRPVRFKQTIALQGATVDSTFNLYDWGTPVQIKAPATGSTAG